MSYPWVFPSITPSNIEFTSKTQTAKFTSPFSGKTQTTRFQAGQWWELKLSFPPLQTTQAQTLSGFLTGLGGQDGTFTFKIPSMFRLTASVSGSIAANGNDFTLNSGTPVAGLFGTDSVNSRLVQFTTTASVFPALSAGAVTINPANGALFRLASNEVRYTVNEMRDYGIEISIIEAI